MAIRIDIIGDAAHLHTPYNSAFVTKVKKISGARWQSDKKAWSIPAAAVDAARSIMRDVFGEDDRPNASGRVSVRLAFDPQYDFSSLCDDYILLGKCLSHATGRDSGASPGEDVAYTKGGPISCGSVKNWRSGVESGSVVMLYNVPRDLFDATGLPEHITAEIVVPNTINRDELESERARLVARIAEIDNLLI